MPAPASSLSTLLSVAEAVPEPLPAAESIRLIQALTAIPGVYSGSIISAAGRRTPTYTKPMYGQKELSRLDIKNRTPTPDSVQDMLLDLLEEAWPQLDALIVLDQVSEADCGVVTARVRGRLADLGESDPAKLVLADSRERVGQFRAAVNSAHNRVHHAKQFPSQIAVTVVPAKQSSSR